MDFNQKVMEGIRPTILNLWEYNIISWDVIFDGKCNQQDDSCLLSSPKITKFSCHLLQL